MALHRSSVSSRRGSKNDNEKEDEESENNGYIQVFVKPLEQGNCGVLLGWLGVSNASLTAPQLGVLYGLVVLVVSLLLYQLLRCDLGYVFQRLCGLVVPLFCILCAFYWISLYFRRTWSNTSVYLLFCSCYLGETFAQVFLRDWSAGAGGGGSSSSSSSSTPAASAVADGTSHLGIPPSSPVGGGTHVSEPLVIVSVLLSISVASIFSSLETVHSAFVILLVSFSRFLACSSLLDFPYTLRPFLAYTCGFGGFVLAKYMEAVLKPPIQNFMTQDGKIPVIKRRRSSSSSAHAFSAHRSTRRTSLPALIQKHQQSSSVSYESAIIGEAHGLITDMLADTTLPPHIISGLRAVSNLLKPVDNHSAVHRPKVSPLVSLTESSTYGSDNEESPYTGERPSSLPKRLRRSLPPSLIRRMSTSTWTTTTSATGMPTLEPEPCRIRSASFRHSREGTPGSSPSGSRSNSPSPSPNTTVVLTIPKSRSFSLASPPTAPAHQRRFQRKSLQASSSSSSTANSATTSSDGPKGFEPRGSFAKADEERDTLGREGREGLKVLQSSSAPLTSSSSAAAAAATSGVGGGVVPQPPASSASSVSPSLSSSPSTAPAAVTSSSSSSTTGVIKDVQYSALKRFNITSDYESSDSPSSSDHSDNVPTSEDHKDSKAEERADKDAAEEDSPCTANQLLFDVSEAENDSCLQISSINSWDYPIFEVADKLGEFILSKVAYKIFMEVGLFETFRIPLPEFIHYFHALELGYRDKPYHNRVHATDVLHGVYFLTTQPIPGFTQINALDVLSRQNAASSSESESENTERVTHRSSFAADDSYGIMGGNLPALELMALYTAAAMHDFDHPGRTNAFLVATHAPEAVLYNDRSVLENHHAASAWRILLNNPAYNFLSGLDKPEFNRFRFLVIEAILATDLKRHFEILAEFNAKVNADDAPGVDWTSETDRLLVTQMVIKIADINGPAKRHDLHVQWTERIAEEFYEQGDEEAARGMAISPYMDRHNPQLAKLQETFINHLVAPLCNSLVTGGLIPGTWADDDKEADVSGLSDSERGDTEKDTEDETETDPESSPTAPKACKRPRKVNCILTKNMKENYEVWFARLQEEQAAAKRAEEQQKAEEAQSKEVVAEKNEMEPIKEESESPPPTATSLGPQQPFSSSSPSVPSSSQPARDEGGGSAT